MKEQIVNILIIENLKKDAQLLLSTIQSPGNNIFTAKNEDEAQALLIEKDIAIVFYSIDIHPDDSLNFIRQMNQINSSTRDIYIIAISKHKEKVYELVDGIKKGAVDYLLKPFVPNLVKTKLDVYKRIYFKNRRILSLLENIFPQHILEELNRYGKTTPQKFDNASVLFTDFVGFSHIVKEMSPRQLIHQLDYYFSAFDEIIQKYGLEKIKTMGDAYMAVGGVTSTALNVELNTALAAIEIKQFMQTEIAKRKALGKDYWDMRIGIHSGELIAGVIGKYKFSFDVWGDTVNIGARCEQYADLNRVNASSQLFNKIKTYFNGVNRGPIEVKKQQQIEMYHIDQIKAEFSMNGKGEKPNSALRELAGLPKVDFEGLRDFILLTLKSELDENLEYHSIEHTLNVEAAAIKYAQLENLSEEETLFIRTAALFHDAGFLIQYKENEPIGVKIMEKYAPAYGFTSADIQTIGKIIMATHSRVEPKNLMEKIMCDADHDYLGRKDYHFIANKLYRELEVYEHSRSIEDWLKMQIDYLENKHQYYTTTAFNLRQAGKELRIQELKDRLARL